MRIPPDWGDPRGRPPSATVGIRGCGGTHPERDHHHADVTPNRPGGRRWQARISPTSQTCERPHRSPPRSHRWRASSGSTPPSGSRPRRPGRGCSRTARTGWRVARRSRAGGRSCASTSDFMQLILLGAALVNQLVTGDTGTTVVLAGLTVFNAVIGLRQESKAEESVKALVADDEDDRAGPSRRSGGRDRRRGAGARRRGAGRGGQPRAGRRPGQPGRDARDRGSSADRREPPGREVDPSPCPGRTSRSATGPAWRT